MFKLYFSLWGQFSSFCLYKYSYASIEAGMIWTVKETGRKISFLKYRSYNRVVDINILSKCLSLIDKVNTILYWVALLIALFLQYIKTYVVELLGSYETCWEMQDSKYSDINCKFTLIKCTLPPFQVLKKYCIFTYPSYIFFKFPTSTFLDLWNGWHILFFFSLIKKKKLH